MAATIAPGKLAKIRSGRTTQVVLLDVRTPVEFREIHVDFARNVPLDRLDVPALRAEASGRAGEPLFVICRSGNRAQQACERLAAAGVKAVNVEGGTQAWEAAGLPVIRGPKAISLERQVRIAAGCLTLLSGVFALTVHPYFAALSAFIGAGLMFAGVTDTCGMGMLLAKMPWNQVGGASDGATCKA